METVINENGYALEWKKGTRWNEKSFAWYLECKDCNEPTRIGDESVAWVLCPRCTSKSLKEYNENAPS